MGAKRWGHGTRMEYPWNKSINIGLKSFESIGIIRETGIGVITEF